jgi:hypothetical protein
LQAITTLRAYRPLPATSSAVPESVGRERNPADLNFRWSAMLAGARCY